MEGITDVSQGIDVVRAEWVNILEEKLEGAEVANSTVALDFRAFEIKTLKLYLR